MKRLHVHMPKLVDDYHVASLLPLPVQSLDTGEATGYNSNFYIDQCQLAESNWLQLSRNWKCIVKQLPLWRWQYRTAAICCMLQLPGM